MATTPSPLDSGYNAGVARLLFQNKNQRDDLTTQGSQDQQDFNTAIQRMARQRGIDLLAQNHQANREGLFYSGQLTKRRGEVEHDYSERQGDSQRDYDRRAAARALALQRLGTVTADGSSPLGYTATGAAGLDLNDMYNDAVGRQLERDRQARLDAQDAADRAAAAAAAAPSGGGGGAPAPVAGNSRASGETKVAPSAAHGGALYVYRHNSNGSWTPIRPANAFGN